MGEYGALGGGRQVGAGGRTGESSQARMRSKKGDAGEAMVENWAALASVLSRDILR